MEIEYSRYEPLSENPTFEHVGSVLVDGIRASFYANACTDVGREGQYHLFAQIADVRDPLNPIIINTVPTVTEDGPEDGHYTMPELVATIPGARVVFEHTRQIAGSTGDFVRGLYAMEAITRLLGVSPEDADLFSGDVGGSQDDNAPDMLGDFDLNGLLN